MLGGMAFRLCYALRLDKDEDWSSDTCWRDREMRRRTFWTAFLVDRFSGAGSDVQVPWSIDAECCTQRLPAREVLFLQSQPVSTPCIFDRNSFHGDIGCIAYIVRLAEIWGRLARYVCHSDGDIPPDNPSSPYQKLKKELQSWLNNLPDTLTFTPENLTANVTRSKGGCFAFMVSVLGIQFHQS